MASYHGAPRQRTRRRMNAGEWLSAIVIIGALGAIGYWQAWPKLTTVSAPAAQQQATRVPALPTMADAARQEAQQAAPNTAVETLPIATPQANQPAAAPQAADPASFSPQDLGNAPLPTPTSALPPEQQQAAAEASEMADLANAQAGLTPAQLETKVHDACWNAGGCGVAK
jgi:hypothetical protein